MSRELVKHLSENELFYGHKACGGCGGSLAVRMALKTLGEKTFTVIPAGCMSAVSFNYPQLCFASNAIISTFAGTASMMTGISAGLRALGVKDYQVLGIAGDGGTADIGLQALSGAIDRREQMIYICYDNEAYMNTGVQKSGLTPFGAQTTTTPNGQLEQGNLKQKKNMFEIMAAHEIAYAATASVGYIEDFIGKVKKASLVKGPAFIHVMAPCPTGWGIAPNETIEFAREIVDTGLWYLAEYYEGHFYLNRTIHTFKNVEHYLLNQKRFKHLSKEACQQIERQRDQKWAQIRSEWRCEDAPIKF